jgi:DNA repair protein RecN (Recombination protein N)
MLKLLTVSNYALIDKADIEFRNGFSVITGETGAGKSILLGALGLILGQRADALVLKDKNQKCVVEGTFNISDYGLEGFMADNDIDFEPVTIIRREILPTGKSRAFINDTPVNLSALKEMTSQLIDIHSQHQTLLIGENKFQLMVVDTVAGVEVIKQSYQSQFQAFRELNLQLARLKDENARAKADYDYLQFQFNQLSAANLIEGEQEELEQRLQQLTHAEEIKQALTSAIELLSGENFPVVTSIREIKTHISKIESFIGSGTDIVNRLEMAYIDLKDLAEELEEKAEAVEHNPDEVTLVQQRLNVIYDLQQKHRVNTVSELIAIRTTIEQKLQKITGFDEEVEKLEKQLSQAKESLTKKGNELTTKRKSVFNTIETSITRRLADLGMPSARFVINCIPTNDFTPNGMDDITFLFSANKSGEPAELEKVASGGEMSRLMLGIKTLISTAKGLPTLVLDEIDTGVSGEIADKMGMIMLEMSKHIQVISITHLPQIAGRGNTHYKVFKTENHHATVSNIEILTPDQRITEIAKMLSGAELSDAAINNAKELLRN